MKSAAGTGNRKSAQGASSGKDIALHHTGNIR